jgi:hypothetical protein
MRLSHHIPFLLSMGLPGLVIWRVTGVPVALLGWLAIVAIAAFLLAGRRS